MHTPPDILAQNFAAPAEAFAKTPLHDRYIFQSNLPGPLTADQAAVLGPKRPPKKPVHFSLKGQPFARETPGGTVRIADSRNFLANRSIAASLVTLRPGALHWHPNVDEWQYYIKGKAQVGVSTAGGIGLPAARVGLAAAVCRSSRHGFGGPLGSRELRD